MSFFTTMQREILTVKQLKNKVTEFHHTFLVFWVFLGFFFFLDWIWSLSQPYTNTSWIALIWKRAQPNGQLFKFLDYLLSSLCIMCTYTCLKWSKAVKQTCFNRQQQQTTLSNGAMKTGYDYQKMKALIYCLIIKCLFIWCLQNNRQNYCSYLELCHR